MALHIIQGTTAPTIIPTKLGQHYINTVNGDSYISVGTSSTSDWKLTNSVSSPVDSVFGRTGNVTAQTGDYTPSQVGAEPAFASGTTSQYFRGDKTFQTLDKTAVGLSNVDNTSDLNKPISTATQTALNAKEPTITAGTTSQYYRGDKTFQTLDKTAVGLSNVDNTSDLNKPISTATQTALNLKVDANSAISGATHTKITYDLKGLVLSGSQAALTDLSDTAISSPILNDYLKFNGSNWVNAQISTTTNAAQGINYFLTSTASGISGYDLMSKTPDSAAEVDESVVVNNNTQLLASYVSDTTLNDALIDPGVWAFNIFSYVSTPPGVTYLTISVYKRTSGGTETLLFSANTPDIDANSATLYYVETVQPSYITNITDKLVFKFYATTNNTSNTTVHLVHSGTTHYSFVGTPLVVHHNDLSDLQGGASNEYYHLTASEYTGTGSGVFVRSNSPNITTPTGIVKGDVGLSNVDNTSDLNKPISTAMQTALNLKANLISPTFTGTPAAPTATAGTSTTQLATTAFVATSYAPLTSPTLTGVPLAPTATAGTNTTQIATTAFVTTAVSTKEPLITSGTTSQYFRGDKTFQTLDKTAVGLSNVDNTSDLNKAIAGDVTGSLGTATVVKLQNRAIANTLPTNGQALAYNSTTSQWEPQTVGGGAGISVVTTSNTNQSLTAADNNYQIYTGVIPGQKVTLPDATTLAVGTDFFLVNKSTSIIPVFKNGGTLFAVLYPEQYLEALVTDASTAAGIWFGENAVPIPQIQSQLFDDFIGSGITSGSIGQLGWTLVAGGGHTVVYNTGAATDYGILNMGTGTGVAAGYIIHLGNTASVVGGGIRINEWRVRFPTLATTGQDYTTYIGLINTITATAEPTNGIYFAYARATSTNWLLKTANGGTRTSTTTAVPVAVNTWYKISMVVNAAGTQIDYYIDYNFIGSISTNITTAAVAPSWISIKTVGATDITQNIDYMYDFKNFSAVR